MEEHIKRSVGGKVATPINMFNGHTSDSISPRGLLLSKPTPVFVMSRNPLATFVKWCDFF
jgi:hypothetical protein